ncbi:hypothetical protein FHS96_000067 [Sphingomonas zeicaulis]|uniref:hypothetical protein n=1 Tax=Sphingomonas zeicaulis TaxID=1632740 RepID=UPI003D1A6EB2
MFRWLGGKNKDDQLAEQLRNVRGELETIGRLIAASQQRQQETISVLRSIEELSRAQHSLMASWIMGRPFEMDGRYQDLKSLSRYNRKVYSQLGEDGIISEIISRIGRVDGIFVECGVGNGLENTTRFLLENGWTGYWFEANDDDVRAAGEIFRTFIDEGRLKIVNALITIDNVNELMDEAGVPAKFDYLSVDLDYVTPQIWETLDRKSRIACVEMNPSLPQNIAARMPYIPDQMWDGTNWYGGSLKTLENIGRDKNMALVGCDLTGTNGFFVDYDETGDKFRRPFDADTHYEPPRNFYPFGLHHPSPHLPREWLRKEPIRRSSMPNSQNSKTSPK